jgi:GntR family transcriptional regulator/MocR family aminotransferase
LAGKVRTNSGVLVVLDHDARIPLHRQVETSIRDSIRAGRPVLLTGSCRTPSRLLRGSRVQRLSRVARARLG